ncbi:MAG TPA: protein-disulfide reductase DsbD N-terminal domain-containing protein [Gemmatimonadaceae bacterium]|nr:protein-disulfide reductase DsbD N-terminal domain-containing protein [Gemmatimonadaceae bacterium]
MNKIAYLLLIPLLAATNQPPQRVATPGEAVPMRAVEGRRALSIRPVRWSVVGGGAPLEVTSGRTVPITLQADIAKGWHIYSLNQKPGGPIPLSIQLINAGDVVVRGVVKATKAERLFDKNFGIETELYSGSPRFVIPVGVPSHTLTGTRKIQVGVRYQVCSATLCLPARTDKLGVTLLVTGRK